VPRSSPRSLDPERLERAIGVARTYLPSLPRMVLEALVRAIAAALNDPKIEDG